MQIEDNPILWRDQLWSALQRAITSLTDHPQSALGYRRNTKDGLNIIAVNSLAKDAKLSDRPVFKVREEKGKDGRLVRRWLHVNHPGAADPMTNVKIFESIHQTPIRPSIVDRIIAYLKAWQSARAKQMKVTPGSNDGGSAAEYNTARPTPMHTDEATPATDWCDVQRRLEILCDRGEPWPGQQALGDRLGCVKSTVSKAVNNSRKLERWMAEARRSKNAPRASSLTEVVTDNTAQTAESDPSDVLTDEDIDNAMRRLIEEAEPEEKARLNGLSEDERRILVKVFYDQNLDHEPSPLEDDPPGKLPRKVKEYKRL